MERPRLFEYPIYAVILGVAGAFVYDLPPFTYEVSRSTADVQPASSTAALERQAAPVDEESGSAEDNPAQDETASTPDAAEPNVQRTSLSEDEAGEQPELDPEPNLLRVTANSLNMRAEPNAHSPRVGSYPKGAVVEPVTTQGNWVLVRTRDDATTGWMYVDYLDQVAGN